MTQISDKNTTLWNSTFQKGNGVPEDVAANSASEEEMEQILKSSPNAEKAAPYEAQIDERIFATIFG